MQPGDTFDVSIIGSGFAPTLTNGGDFRLSFNLGLLQFPNPVVDTSVWEFASIIDTSVPGTISFSVASFSDRGPDFPIATVTFDAIGVGVSALDLAGDPWAGVGGSAIPVNYVDGRVNIPLPAAAWLLLSAVGAVGTFGVRRRPVAEV